MARLVRRVCVLRERGETAAAENLQAGALANLIASLPAAADAPQTVEQRIEAIFHTEQERVANASALAELLLPLLTDSAPLFGALPEPPLTAMPSPSPMASHEIEPPKTPRRPGDIADFLDDMIAQERAEETAPASRRRAS